MELREFAFGKGENMGSNPILAYRSIQSSYSTEILPAVGTLASPYCQSEMAFKSQKEAEAEVRKWGFSHVFTWTDGPNAHYPPHDHSGLTTHLILRGQLTVTYPDDPSPSKETFGPGGRLDVDARRSHEVWMGPEGCTYVIGE
ncbi:hypothetical protein M8818_002701 [Zalaria obscura]|uniref:Uncharacterized protein n=1 Tax=Zalaria obscura TaxID=2024903 RepID=A0ACC3SL17_9PEZI